jgi:Lipocalin-like domain
LIYVENFSGDGDMRFDASAIPEQLFGTWKQLSGRYVDVDTGEERPGLSQAPNGYIHFARNGRLFNMTVDSARHKPAGPRATDEEAQALFRTLIAYTGTFEVKGNQVLFDVDVSWNESWTGSRQVRTFELDGDDLKISAEIINPMTGRPARHQLTFTRWSA